MHVKPQAEVRPNLFSNRIVIEKVINGFRRETTQAHQALNSSGTRSFWWTDDHGIMSTKMLRSRGNSELPNQLPTRPDLQQIMTMVKLPIHSRGNFLELGRGIPDPVVVGVMVNSGGTQVMGIKIWTKHIGKPGTFQLSPLTTSDIQKRSTSTSVLINVGLNARGISKHQGSQKKEVESGLIELIRQKGLILAAAL